MEKHCEITERFGKEAHDINAVVEALTESLLAKSREALQIGGSQARRQIVQATMRLDGLLSEATRSNGKEAGHS